MHEKRFATDLLKVCERDALRGLLQEEDVRVFLDVSIRRNEVLDVSVVRLRHGDRLLENRNNNATRRNFKKVQETDNIVYFDWFCMSPWRRKEAARIAIAPHFG